MSDNKRLVFTDCFREHGGIQIPNAALCTFGLEMAAFLAILVSADGFFEKESKKKNKDYDGWFFSTKQYRSEKYGISVKTLKRLMSLATKQNLVETKMKGLPIKQFIRINYENIEAAMYSNEPLNASIDESCDACITDESEHVNRSRTRPLDVYRSRPVDVSRSRPLLYNENINKNLNNNMSDFDFEQNEPISSVPPLGNSSVQKPKVSGRPARKPIQEIVTSEPKIDASKRPKRPVIKYLDLFPLDFQSDPTFKHAWSEWVEYKSTDKKGNKVLFKEQTAKGMKTKLLAFSKNDTETACKIIDMAISNGWSGLYELYDSKPTVKKYHENFKSDTKGKYDNIKETVINMDEED